MKAHLWTNAKDPSPMEVQMRKFWVLLQKRKSAREVITLLVPIVIAVAGGFWAVFTYVFPTDKPGNAAHTPAVSAGPGGVAAGRDISNSMVNIGSLPVLPPESLRR
jgi:hypothetical protein